MAREDGRRHQVYREVLTCLADADEPLTAREIAERIGCTPWAVWHNLRVLTVRGEVRRAGRRLVGRIYAQVYARPDR